MKIVFHPRFIRNFKNRIRPNSYLLAQYEICYKLFVNSNTLLVLNDHQLTGYLQDKRAFNITDDIRVVYRIIGRTVIFLDIGTHQQVYGEETIHSN